MRNKFYVWWIFLFIFFSTYLSRSAFGWTKHSIEADYLFNYRSSSIYRSDVSSIDVASGKIFILSGNGPHLGKVVTDKVDIIPFLKPDAVINIFELKNDKITRTIKLRSVDGFFVGTPLDNSIDSRLNGAFYPIATTEENTILPSNKRGLLPLDFIKIDTMFYILDGYGPRIMTFTANGMFLRENYLKPVNQKASNDFERSCTPISIKRNKGHNFSVVSKCDDGNMYSLLYNNNFEVVSKNKLPMKVGEYSYVANCGQLVAVKIAKSGEASVLNITNGEIIATLRGSDFSFGCDEDKVRTILARNLSINCFENKCISDNKINFWQN